jgi:ferritin-like metal-binding protein YciE
MPTTKNTGKTAGTSIRSANGSGSARSGAKTKAAAGSKTAIASGNSSKGTSVPGQSGKMQNSQLAEFFQDSLKDIYWAEKALLKALPKMKKAASTEELKGAIDDHTEQTKGHVTRLEEVFGILGKKAQAKKCDAMEGLIKEGESIVEETEDGSMTRDAAIIIAAQKVEHYEIATYGGLAQLAETMQQSEIAELLRETLEEEKGADALLTEIAENDINWSAEQEDEDDE